MSIFDSLFQELRREVVPEPTEAEPDVSRAEADKAEVVSESPKGDASGKALASAQLEFAEVANGDEASYELLVLIFHLRRSAAAKDHLARYVNVTCSTRAPGISLSAEVWPQLPVLLVRLRCTKHELCLCG